MIKRINSTGRRRIARDHVVIEVFDDSPRSFNASIDLAGFDAPAEAAVVLEATCAGSNTISRFEFGTVGEPAPQKRRILQDLHGENVFFSLKVIDRSERLGRLLGLAEHIRPLKGGAKTATGRKGILPVEKADLGDELWRLEFRVEDVFLLVNERIPDLADRVRFDAALYSLIYPSIIREVLYRAFDEQRDSDEDDERWPTLWLRFAHRLHPEQESPPEDEDDEVRQEWIGEVVSAFCRDHSLREKFSQAAGGQGWEEAV
ncbi:MAG: hypothetical protein IH987_10505 [Planctomycetes bacterium]|nr:hypothetical protein [Planctomycetota bacterium]